LKNIKLTKKNKLLVIADSFPPYLDASAVLISNILSKYEGEIEAIGGNSFTKVDEDFLPPCKTTYINLPKGRIVESVLQRIHYLLLPYYFLRIFNLAKKIKPTVIFGNYPNEVMFVAAYLVSKRLKLPFYSYMHDLWEENMKYSGRKTFALKWEKEILTHSKRLICCTKYQQEYYKNKYGLDSELLLHPVLDERISEFKGYNKRKDGAEKKIAFVGSLSSNMNEDALITISKAIALLPQNFKFYWYPITDIPKDFLEKKGFDISRIVIKVISTKEMLAEISGADILIAPLSFKNCSEHEVKTVFSNKLLIYLTSGTPILVFSPKDSFHSVIARNDKWGLVVDEDNIEKLSKEINNLIHDQETQKELVLHAILESKRRTSSSQAINLLRWVQSN
jgi:glycosyltransferase involved in cell wall biosynthesis